MTTEQRIQEMNRPTTVRELKAQCKAKGLRGYSKLRKAELYALLEIAQPPTITVAQLRIEARRLGIVGRSKMRKIELLTAIVAEREAEAATAAEAATEATQAGTGWADVLGVDHLADFATVKAAYRTLVAKAHPDAGGNEADFYAIQNAYELAETVYENRTTANTPTLRIGYTPPSTPSDASRSRVRADSPNVVRVGSALVDRDGALVAALGRIPESDDERAALQSLFARGTSTAREKSILDARDHKALVYLRDRALTDSVRNFWQSQL